MNEEERARKRENSVRERRKARVCIVVNFLNSHLACSRLQESEENGSKKCEKPRGNWGEPTASPFDSKLRHRFNRGFSLFCRVSVSK